MTDEKFFQFMEEEGVDEALRLVIIEAWLKVQEEMNQELIKCLN